MTCNWCGKACDNPNAEIFVGDWTLHVLCAAEMTRLISEKLDAFIQEAISKGEIKVG